MVNTAEVYIDLPEPGDTTIQPSTDSVVIQQLAKVSAELAALKSQDREQVPATSTQLPPKDPPRAGDYDTHEAYVEALTDYKVDARLTAFTREQQEAQRVKAHDDIASRFASRYADACTNSVKYPDFEQHINNTTDINLSNDLMTFLRTTSSGIDIMYGLASNPTVFRKISMMPYADAVVACSRFAKGSIPVKSRADSVVTPVRGGGTRQVNIQTMSLSEYRAARDAKLI